MSAISSGLAGTLSASGGVSAHQVALTGNGQVLGLLDTTIQLGPGSGLTILDDGNSAILANGHLSLSGVLVLSGPAGSSGGHLVSAGLTLGGTLALPVDVPPAGFHHELLGRLHLSGTLTLDAAGALSAALTVNDQLLVRTVRDAGGGEMTPTMRVATGQLHLTGSVRRLG